MLDRDISVIMFTKSEISDFMHACDMDDCGMKIFGSFDKGVITFNGEQTKRLRDTTLNKRAIRALLQVPNCYFAQSGLFYALRDERVKMFSMGNQFIFLPEFEKKLESMGIKKIDVSKIKV